MIRNSFTLCIALLCLIVTVSAEESYRVSGSAYEVILSEEREDLGEGRTLVTEQAKHLWVAEDADPSNPLPRRGTCFATRTAIYEADGITWTGASITHCQDEDGDSYWLAGSGTQAGGSYHQILGTGKFRDIEHEGTWKPGTGVQFKNGTSISTWEETETIP